MADNTRLIATAVIGAFLALAIATCDVQTSNPPPPAPAVEAVEPSAPSLTPEEKEMCRSFMSEAQSVGVIKKVEQRLMRLTVDEPMWREMGPDGRKTLMGAAACDWFGARLSSLRDGQRVTIVGWQSGDRVASSMGGLYSGD